jgi:hypothetical protein
MLSPYTITAAFLAAVLFTILFRLYQGRRARRFASGGYIPGPVRLSYPHFEHTRPPGKHHDYPKVITRAEQIPDGHRRPPTMFLTPRMLEHINVQRKLRNKPALNAGGFRNAVAHAWDQPVRQPDNMHNWIGYLIAYEVMFGGHQSNRVACDTGISIEPTKPYNGQGGEFAGAGASGQWDDGTAQAARDIASGVYSVPETRAEFKESSLNPQIDIYAAVAASVATPDLTLRDGGASSFTEPGTGQVVDQRSASTPDPSPDTSSSDKGGYQSPASAPDPSPASALDTSSSSGSDGGGGGGGGE